MVVDPLVGLFAAGVRARPVVAHMSEDCPVRQCALGSVHIREDIPVESTANVVVAGSPTRWSSLPLVRLP